MCCANGKSIFILKQFNICLLHRTDLSIDISLTENFVKESPVVDKSLPRLNSGFNTIKRRFVLVNLFERIFSLQIIIDQIREGVGVLIVDVCTVGGHCWFTKLTSFNELYVLIVVVVVMVFMVIVVVIVVLLI